MTSRALMGSWWVGGYGADMGGTMTGIQAMRTKDDGTLELVGEAAPLESPSYLLGLGDRVYAVAEGAGTVDAFRRTGEHTLEREWSASSGGRWPCSLAAFGGGIAVANYFDGVVGLVEDAELAHSVALEGSGPHERQQGPHAHTVLAVDAQTLLSVDLGADRVTVHGPGLAVRASFALPPGTGPRDLVRHPSGLYLLLSELSHELFVLRWTGSALEILAVSPVPGAEEGDNDSAISLWGDFVYTGLRGSNRIAVTRLNGSALEPVGWVSAEGDWPRHHAVEGDVLHVAHQLSNSVGSFGLGADGLPRLIADPTPVASPNYLLAAGRC